MNIASTYPRPERPAPELLPAAARILGRDETSAPELPRRSGALGLICRVRSLHSDLLALERKYRTLLDLRRAAREPDVGVLRALASEFPGALRELEILPLATLERRLQTVTGAVAGGEPSPWVHWMLAYHRRMCLVLAIKRKLGEARLEPGAIARGVGAEFGEELDSQLVAKVARPPGGRLNRLVFELLEGEFGRSRAELESTLFPALARPVAACGLER
ncbi:MAG TPA: hypothetical protein VIM73_02990 [Polyangiaceae bacterium]